jgi:nucleotide-binding universal stress UspA family protein
MMKRILVAIDDSSPALAAAALAIELASTPTTALRFVTVIEPGRDPDAILRHVRGLARDRGISPTLSAVDDGDTAFEAILIVAQEWRADLIVMGRSDKRRPGGHYVGSQTEHLLEFTDIPVLVVPAPPSHDPRSQQSSGS